MIRLRLRAVIPVSFSKSEATNFEELAVSREYGELIKSLSNNDTISLVSMQQDQIVFIRGYTEVKTSGEQPWLVLFSQRVRVRRGPGHSNAIEPKMLANYARDVGIELIGIKLLEEHYEHLKHLKHSH